MMNYVANNLLYLRKHYPQIYEFIRNRQYDQSRINVFKSKNGQVNLLDEKSDDGYKTALYSRYNPEREVAIWLDSLDDTFHNAEHVLFCGLGFGYHLKGFIEKFPDKMIYLYEPEVEYFLAAIENIDLTNLLSHKQISIFAVGNDRAVQNQVLEMTFRVIKGSYATIIVPAYHKLHQQTIRELEKNIHRNALNMISAINTISVYQKDWAENILRNMEQNLKTYSFSAMKKTCTGIPAVVVGSGPSLEMEIKHLRKLKGKVVIIAAGSSIQALLRYNLEPDLAVSIDPSKRNYDIYKHLDLQEIPFLYFPTIQHKIIENTTPYMMHAFLNTDSITHYLMDLNEHDVIFNSTSTVTGQAIQAAIYLGCSEIVLIGQDFSFPNERFYSDGVGHMKQNVLEDWVDKADQYVQNVTGGVNRTNMSMLALKYSVEALLDLFDYGEFYNASPVGAVIERTKLKSLEKLYEENKHVSYPSGWFKQKIEKHCRHYPAAKISQIIERIRLASEAIEEVQLNLEEIEEHFKDLDDYQDSNQEKIERWFSDFDDKWNKMISAEHFNHLYLYLVQREYNYVQRYWNELSAQPNSYEKIVSVGTRIAPLVSAIKKVTPYLQENFAWLIRNIDHEEKRRTDDQGAGNRC